jgi:hypothetical protein
MSYNEKEFNIVENQYEVDFRVFFFFCNFPYVFFNYLENFCASEKIDS